MESFSGFFSAVYRPCRTFDNRGELMSLESQLFHAMLDDPEDMDLRLVFADWYQEHADPRAEFIQLQIALFRLPRQHAWRAEMEDRQRDLLKEHRKEWDAPLYQLLNQTPLKGQVRSRRGLVRGWQYRRGFVEHLSVDAGVIISSFHMFRQLGPLRSLRLWNVPKVLRQFSRWEGLTRFAKLDLRHNPLGDAGLARFFHSPFLENLEELSLVDTELTDLSLDVLTSENRLPALKRLVLSQNPFSRDGWERLLFRFGDKLEHENGNLPLTSYLKKSESQDPAFLSYDDEILYDGGHIDTEGKRQVDGEWVEGYDEYEGFEEFDEDGLKHLGGYQDYERSDSWIGPNHEPDYRPEEWEEEDD